MGGGGWSKMPRIGEGPKVGSYIYKLAQRSL